MKTVEKRFLAKVNKTEGCWEWAGFVTPAGYGVMKVSKRIERAHRVSYELANGPIPAGMAIDHICRNKTCVKPEHLRPTTCKQNMENLPRESRCKSGVRGVNWVTAMNKWRVTVIHNRQYNHGGYFSTIAEAEVAVVALRNKLFTHNDADRAA